MKTSETIGKISEALAKAQAILTNPTKDAENPHFRSRYASLDTGLNIVRKALSANNIAFTQGTRLDGDLLILETLLSHGSGEWMQSEYPVARFPVKQQELGSAMTYAKRYSLFGFVGIAGEDDDDGNAANARDIPARKQPEPQKTPATPKDESKKIYDALAQTLIMAESMEQIDGWVSNNLKAIETLNDDHKTLLRKAIKDLRGEMQKDAA
jgi:hypothetical protein